jgi:hypothetical protein
MPFYVVDLMLKAIGFRRELVCEFVIEMQVQWIRTNYDGEICDMEVQLDF